jgi:SAM-dependent methyltransferase
MDHRLSDPTIDEAVVSRYRANYNFGTEIGKNEVRQHWQLESALTQKLLASNKDNRWAVFEDCYTELYSKLPWLNVSDDSSLDQYWPWASLISKNSKIFEIGSGGAHLLKYLVSQGYDCVATEVTRERGARHSRESAGLAWHVTDGVNLKKFEEPESYEVAISSQVIEHLHPDDILDHFTSVREILKPNGQYIFDTPHAGIGPCDLSVVFGFQRPVCMHLKEYNFIELGEIIERAGFKTVKAVLFRRRPFAIGPWASSCFYRYCRAWDRAIKAIGLSPDRERAMRSALRLLFVPTNIWMIAAK